jgi:hypothetical protein
MYLLKCQKVVSAPAKRRSEQLWNARRSQVRTYDLLALHL